VADRFVPRIRSERGLAIQVHLDASSTVIELEGDLDISTFRALEEELERAEAADPEKLVIDLSAVRFADSQGIACLIQAVERAGDRDLEIQFLRGPASIERVFEITGLADYLPFAD
jgi:anti-sigma B factor antagonist